MIDVNTEMTEISGLSYKDFQIAIIKMGQWAIMSMLETNKRKEFLRKEIKSLSKEIRHNEEPKGNWWNQ